MKHYWTEKEHRLLETVSTFEETAEVALTILARMSHPNREIAQICGPMSTGGLGNLRANMIRFQLAVDRALDNGLVVFDQIPFQQAIIRLCKLKKNNQTEYDWEILEIFYRQIFESGHVHRTLFLPGWQESIGARWERELVTKLGLIVEEYPTHWLA